MVAGSDIVLGLVNYHGQSRKGCLAFLIPYAKPFGVNTTLHLEARYNVAESRDILPTRTSRNGEQVSMM